VIKTALITLKKTQRLQAPKVAGALALFERLSTFCYSFCWPHTNILVFHQH
jgi:hypothetical protein